MTQPRYDVIAIGNAIVDIIAPCDEETLDELQLARGGMTLVDAAGADKLYDAMGPATEKSGGSAANTLAGLAQLGVQCAFIGQVADDQFGKVFAHDIRAAGAFLEGRRSDGSLAEAAWSGFRKLPFDGLHRILARLEADVGHPRSSAE